MVRQAHHERREHCAASERFVRTSNRPKCDRHLAIKFRHSKQSAHQREHNAADDDR
jgi:hypothetical protein